jgi:tetratricopeptide (TPR) repeat protein
MFLDAYPGNELVPEARFTLGLIHDSQANFEQAATWFESVSEFEDFELHDDAVFNAGRLREALSDFDQAIGHYDHYIARTNDPEQAPTLLFRIAQIEQQRGNTDAAFARYQQIRERWGQRPSRRVAATVLQARLRTAQGNVDGARQLYQQAYDQYGAGTLQFDPTTHLPTDWQSAPGWQIEDSAERLAALPYAAESRFTLADRLFQTAQAISLAYPAGRWRVLRDNLIARAEAVLAAEAAMFEVIWMGDAAWSVAAATRIGELYKGFYDDMYALPAVDLDECIDNGASYDECEQLDSAYNDMLYEQMYPIESKARDSLVEALSIAHDNVVYNEWTNLAVQRMVQVDRNLRVVGEEGVAPDDRGALYSGTGYMTDLDAVLARFEALERQAREARAAAMGPGQPGGTGPEGTAAPQDERSDGADGPLGAGPGDGGVE